MCLISPEHWGGYYVGQSTLHMGLDRPAELMANYKREEVDGQHRDRIPGKTAT